MVLVHQVPQVLQFINLWVDLVKGHLGLLFALSCFLREMIYNTVRMTDMVFI